MVSLSDKEQQTATTMYRAGNLALFALLASTWLLLILAHFMLFHLWFVALIPALVAAGTGLWAWSRQTWSDRLALLVLAMLGYFLYTPPAEHLPLTGDSAIYPNEAAFLARTGGLTTTYTPLATLPLATRTLFYVSNEEQFSTITLNAYDGLLYGGYYVNDAESMTIQTSRMPLSTVWLALATALTGIGSALYITSLFATLGVMMLYLIGRQIFAWPIALWAALLLAVSFAQVHFGRAPYAEITGQFWTLAGVLYALLWLRQRSPWLLIMALACWVTTWAGRIDALLLLGPAGLLLLIAATERDWRSLRTVLLALPLFLVGIWLSTNTAYVAATYELLLSRWPWFGSLLITLLGLLIVAVAVMWVAGKPIVALLQRLAPLLQLALLLAFAFIILWATVPNPLRAPGVTRNFQEIIWFSSQLLTPGFYWLALLGAGWLLWRRQTIGEFWLLATTLLLAFAFFYSYTSAAVYPGSLRRLVSDVIPLMALMAGFALAARWPWLSGGRVWPVAQAIVGVALLAWMFTLSWPLLQEEEGAGTLTFIETLHAAVPAESMFWFEEQDGDSWVGWLAAPLYSLYDTDALLFDSDTPDQALLAAATAALLATDRPLYIVSQHEPLPEPLLPPGYRATLEQQLVWQSSLIGQSAAPYPLPIWHFALPVYLYRITE